MGNEVRLYQDNNCFYLLQNLNGMYLYQRTKAKEKFIKHETKILEQCVENAIREIFAKNGINIYDTEESSLNRAFSELNAKGKDIKITDLYRDRIEYHCMLIGCSPNKMTCWLEDGDLLQCGIQVEEIEIGEKL